jgi:hypothetical protein
LPFDHIPHGLPAHRTDYLIVDDHRKDVVSVNPATPRAPSGKRAAALEDRCDEIKKTITPNAIRMTDEAEVIVHCGVPSGGQASLTQQPLNLA